jgi:hypothetical protein
VLIGNTAGDRLVDWVKDFNSYFVPFANAKEPTEIRTPTAGIQLVLLQLSQSQGSDLSLAAQHGGDPARNGEPFGELGMVLSQDAAWPNQQGPARDPQPTNLQPSPDVADSAGALPIWQSASAATPTPTSSIIVPADLAPIVSEAKQLWADALGASDPRLSILDTISVQVGNLPDGKLGVTMGDTILIDSDASGWGWFVDPTPARSTEFPMHLASGALGATKNSPAAQHMDLLSTVLHEMGNAMGFAEDRGQDVTGMMLQPGVRTLPVRSTWIGDGAPAAHHAGPAPSIEWSQRFSADTPVDQTPDWLDDFLSHVGQGESIRNPNAGMRVRIPL